MTDNEYYKLIELAHAGKPVDDLIFYAMENLRSPLSFSQCQQVANDYFEINRSKKDPYLVLNESNFLCLELDKLSNRIVN